MKLLLFLSEITIPLLIFCIVGYGLLNRQPVYEEFVEGAKDGFWTVIKIMPTLIGLMVAVGVLRASGLLSTIRSWKRILKLKWSPGKESLIIPLSTTMAPAFALENIFFC